MRNGWYAVRHCNAQEGMYSDEFNEEVVEDSDVPAILLTGSEVAHG